MAVTWCCLSTGCPHPSGAHQVPAYDLCVVTSCRERAWQRYVDDELHNRDNPLSRPRTQRPQRRVKEGEEANAAAAAAKRRPRPLPSQAGMDEAYTKAYIAADAKRPRRD
jgi:hypothetical protein